MCETKANWLVFILEDKAAVSPSTTETGALCSCLELQNDLHGVSKWMHCCIILSVKWKIKYCFAADILVSKQHMTGDVTHHASLTSFLFHTLHYCWIVRDSYLMKSVILTYAMVGTVYLHFTSWCAVIMWTVSNGEARTKQIHKQGCECCLRLSQLNGGPWKISGVEGCVLQFSTLGPLS